MNSTAVQGEVRKLKRLPTGDLDRSDPYDIKPTSSTNFGPDHDQWNPWETLALEYPHLQVINDVELPGNVWGLSSSSRSRIWLCKRLDSRRRTCTLAHEILHFELGLFLHPDDPGYHDAERTIDDVCSRRMIPFRDLSTVLLQRPNATLGIWAVLLRVELPTLKTRLLMMSPLERTALEQIRGGTLPTMAIQQSDDADTDDSPPALKLPEVQAIVQGANL